VKKPKLRGVLALPVPMNIGKLPLAAIRKTKSKGEMNESQ